MDTNNTDLETFRRQWQEEVTARFRAKEQPSSKGKDHTSGEKLDVPTEKVVLPPSDVPKEEAEAIDGISTQAYHDLDDKEDENRLATEGSAHHLDTQTSKEPKSALEHYEKAIEREDQGNLGDSLKLYRQAFRVSLAMNGCESKLTICSLMQELTKSISTNTFHPPTPRRKLPTQTPLVLRSRFLIPPITP